MPWSLTLSPGCWFFFLNVIVTQISLLWCQYDACECSRGGVSDLRNLLRVTKSVIKISPVVSGLTSLWRATLWHGPGKPELLWSCSRKRRFCWEIQQSKPFKVYSIDFSKWNENLPRKKIDFRNLVLTSPSLSVFLPFIPAFVNLAATTKYHRLSDLNHKHFSLQFWSLRSLRSRCSSQVRAHFLVCPTRQRERGTLSFCLFL